METIDIKKFIEDEEKARDNMVWYKRIYTDFVDDMYYTWYLGIIDLPQELKNLWQKIFRGYSDVDVLNLNYFILRKIYKPFKKFVRYQETRGMGLPTEFETNPGGWLEVLAKIEFSLDYEWKTEIEYEEDFNPYEGLNEEQTKEYSDKIEEGFELFGKHLRSFWD